MNAQPARPIRIGVFSTVASAEQAVADLLDAGFTTREITVLCSAEAKEAHFRQFSHQQPAGTFTPAATATGGMLGAALGGMAVLAGAAATGGVGLLAAGGTAAWAGGIVGGLVGAMLTRGVEKELANFYDQSVTAGKILVAAEHHGDDEPQWLAMASRILHEAGAEPVALPEG